MGIFSGFVTTNKATINILVNMSFVPIVLCLWDRFPGAKLKGGRVCDIYYILIDLVRLFPKGCDNLCLYLQCGRVPSSLHPLVFTPFVVTWCSQFKNLLAYNGSKVISHCCIHLHFPTIINLNNFAIWISSFLNCLFTVFLCIFLSCLFVFLGGTNLSMLFLSYRC